MHLENLILKLLLELVSAKAWKSSDNGDKGRVAADKARLDGKML
jgi:hypothetical protein